MQLFAPLNDANTRLCVEAERAMNRALHGSCHVPVAALAELHGTEMTLRGLVGSASDGRVVRSELTMSKNSPEELGQHVARDLLDHGAGEFL
jgi:hydroxymethylbilane synthase